MTNKSSSASKPSILGGSAIVACVCIGAGMLGLPTAGSQAWLVWSISTLFITMAIMSISAGLILEVLSDYPFQSSFATITKDILGKRYAAFNNAMVYFVGCILLYAYISSMGELIAQHFSMTPKGGAILFTLIFSALVWHSTTLVDIYSRILLVVISITFLLILAMLIPEQNATQMIGRFDLAQSYYALPLLPIALSSFGYHHAVSSLRDYYLDEKRAFKAMLIGGAISLIIYTVWIGSIYGVLSSSDFDFLRQSSGNIDLFISILDTTLNNTFALFMNIFSVAVIVSSFVGVGLGMFDFIADLCHRSPNQRGQTWALTFLPPLLLSLLVPFGFLTAIGFASAAAAIWTCLTPTLMVYKVRKEKAKRQSIDQQYLKGSRTEKQGFQVAGGACSLVIVALFGILVLSLVVSAVL